MALPRACLVSLILLSRFKHSVLLMTVNFVDFVVIDADTFAFLMKIFANLDARAVVAIAVALLALALIWRFDRLRVGRRAALLGAVACLGCLGGLVLGVPSDPWEEFNAQNYFSKFMRSGVTVISDLITRGVLEFDVDENRLILMPPATRRAK